jgi:phage terminase large subunit
MVDRINTVNTMLYNAQGQRRLLISPRCVHLIKALDGLTYKEDANVPDKSSGLDHITDALGYLMMGAFPMNTRAWRSEEFW